MRKNIKAIGLLLAIACISGALYQGTGAYLTDERKVVNHLDFAGAKGMQAVLTEPAWEPEIVLETADKFVELGLRDAGYEYIVY